jgi:hypothetical protein
LTGFVEQVARRLQAIVGASHPRTGLLSVVVGRVSTFASSDGIFASHQDPRIVRHLPVSSGVFGDIHHAADDQNDIVRIGRDRPAHGPMSGWVPARSAGQIDNLSTVAIGHVYGHIVDINNGRPVPEFDSNVPASYPAGSFNQNGKRESDSNLNWDSLHPRVGLHAAMRQVRNNPRRSLRDFFRIVTKTFLVSAFGMVRLKSRQQSWAAGDANKCEPLSPTL